MGNSNLSPQVERTLIAQMKLASLTSPEGQKRQQQRRHDRANASPFRIFARVIVIRSIEINIFIHCNDSDDGKLVPLHLLQPGAGAPAASEMFLKM